MTVTGASNGNSATVDFELTYPAAAPSLEISGIPFAGSMAKNGLDLTMVATSSGALTPQRQLGRHPARSERGPLAVRSYDLRFLNVAQPGTPITATGDNATSATAPANFMLPPTPTS